MTENAFMLKRMQYRLDKVFKSAWKLTRGGIALMVGSCYLLIFKLYQLYTVLDMKRFTTSNEGKVEPKQLREEFQLILEEYKAELGEESLLSRICNDHADRRSVILGRGNILENVLIVNCVVCALFFLQGAVMWYKANDLYKACESAKNGPPTDIAKKLALYEGFERSNYDTVNPNHRSVHK